MTTKQQNNKQTAVVDGTRKRRFSIDNAKRQWYSEHRSRRFANRMANC